MDEVLGIRGQVGRGKDITATRLSLRSQLSKMRTHISVNAHARNFVGADGRRSPSLYTIISRMTRREGVE
jgi:hypothetical protein